MTIEALQRAGLEARYTIDEAARVLRLSRATLYRRARGGHLALVRDGGRSFIAGAELERYLSRNGGRVALGLG